MWWLIGSVLYVATGIAIARMVAGHFAWDQPRHHWQDEPDYDDWLLGWFFGGAIGLMWPLAVIGFLAWKAILNGPRFPLVFGAEREARSRVKQRELSKREARIAQLERELGL